MGRAACASRNLHWRFRNLCANKRIHRKMKPTSSPGLHTFLSLCTHRRNAVEPVHLLNIGREMYMYRLWCRGDSLCTSLTVSDVMDISYQPAHYLCLYLIKRFGGIWELDTDVDRHVCVHPFSCIGMKLKITPTQITKLVQFNQASVGVLIYFFCLGGLTVQATLNTLEVFHLPHTHTHTLWANRLKGSNLISHSHVITPINPDILWK